MPHRGHHHRGGHHYRGGYHHRGHCRGRGRGGYHHLGHPWFGPRPPVFFFGGRPVCPTGGNSFVYGHVSSSDSDGEDVCSGGRPKQPTVEKPDPVDEDVLQVDRVDFKVAENTAKHHTDEYDITEGASPQLVVRRGQQFTIQIDFSRPYDTKKDDLRLVFEIGDQPKASKGTHVEFVLSAKDQEGKWGANIAQQSGKSLTIAVFTPPNCIVGKWRFKVSVVKRRAKRTSVFTYNHKHPIYMLFNPWCKGDTVYLQEAADLEAYVLNDKGKIYSGSYQMITQKPWVFGQFTGSVMDCSMYLLDMAEMAWATRGNPIFVVRKLSAMINSLDEGGVLEGNWTGNYIGGKNPLSWTGSTAILEQFYQQKQPVKYGQCWVFSGLLTTVCRALGIPARSVTNFNSAHDTDCSITIDYHFDTKNSSLDEYDEDSVWNFHVWNEAWMARPDLPTGYGGWQACDSTPQETSQNVYCCGPCPVRAIKEGEVNQPYDGPFIFAEVNADKVYWELQDDNSWRIIHADKAAIGKFLSTMGMDGQREDVTLNYKYPEGSTEERVAVRNANAQGSEIAVYDEGPKDVDFELLYDAKNTFVGHDLKVELRCKNKSRETRSIEGLLCASTMYYTGVVADEVGRQKIDLKLNPGETNQVSISVNEDTYRSKLKECCMFSLSAMARVKETKQVFSKRDEARLRKPHLTIKAPTSGNKGKEMDVELSFTNPLNKTLTDCSLDVEGPGLITAKSYPQGDVAGKGTFRTIIKVKPRKRGKREIVAIFNSCELEDINGSHSITVKP